MSMAYPAQEAVSMGRERKTSAEMAKLIQKLRWLGLDEEAQRLHETLRRRQPGNAAIRFLQETD
jgi:hypothetical protein